MPAAGPDKPTHQQPVGLGRAAGLGAVTSIVALITSVIRSKASAVFLGPSGVGMAAEIQQIATLTLVPLSALSGPALLTALAREKNEGRPPEAIAAAFGWVLLLGVGLSAVALTALFSFLPNSWSEGARPLLALACATTLAAAASSVGIGALTFDGSLNTTARLQMVTGVVAAVMIAAATAMAGLPGQFVAAAVAALITLLAVARAARASSRWPGTLRPRLERTYLRNALVVGAASLIGGGALQAALFAIRVRMEDLGGPEANGQFQAAWAVGSVYLGVVLTGMGTFVFPRYASASDLTQLQQEVDEASRFVMRVAPPVILLAVSFADIGIRLMYSDRFDGALEILKWQFAGDIAKCLSWVYAGPLLYRGNIRGFLTTETLAASALAGGTWALTPLLGLSATGVSYFITYILYLPLAAWVTRRSLGVSPRPRQLALAAVGTAVAVALIGAGHSWFGRSLGLVAAGIWAWRSGVLNEMRQALAKKAKQLPIK